MSIKFLPPFGVLFCFLSFVLFSSHLNCKSYLANESNLRIESDTSLQISTSQFYKFVLVDDSEIIGRLDSTKNDIHYVSTQTGIVIPIPKDKIKKIVKLRGEFIEGKFWRYDPNRTRLLFAPNGRALEGGEGYFSVYQIFFPMVTYGVTNFLALSGGVSLFPGLEKQLVYGNIKVVPYQAEKFSIAVGGFITTGFEEFTGGILYSCATYGTNNNSITVGVGLPYEEWKTGKSPIILLGGDVRISNSLKFITENWIVTSSYKEFVFSAGIRWFEERLSADFGFVSTLELIKSSSGLPAIPWIGFAYNFKLK
ncbi:MAG: hypothetical protein N2560_04270 [Ignavibacteria bacterium]|nr:hypothetical protein [Ignavibacteria bacterium]